MDYWRRLHDKTFINCWRKELHSYEGTQNCKINTSKNSIFKVMLSIQVNRPANKRSMTTVMKHLVTNEMISAHERTSAHERKPESNLRNTLKYPKPTVDTDLILDIFILYTNEALAEVGRYYCLYINLCLIYDLFDCRS